jgi:hypothetical protein
LTHAASGGAQFSVLFPKYDTAVTSSLAVEPVWLVKATLSLVIVVLSLTASPNWSKTNMPTPKSIPIAMISKTNLYKSCISAIFIASWLQLNYPARIKGLSPSACKRLYH